MRLIDIDALPEDCWRCGDAIKEAINNAPTIETESKYLISIQDASDAFKEFRGWMAKDKAYEYVCKLKKLPSAQSERSVIEDEVWGFVKKLEQEIPVRDLMDIYGDESEIYQNFTYQEAKAKYDEFKQKDEIHVGDEVEHTTASGNPVGLKCVVTKIVDDEILKGITQTGEVVTCSSQIKRWWRKTGRHFDEVEELLMKMKEKQNDT